MPSSPAAGFWCRPAFWSIASIFGLRQIWLHVRQQEHAALRFGTPDLHRYVRQPLYAGWLVACWSTPTMTVVHLVLALTVTGSILFAMEIEEPDPVDSLGGGLRRV